MGPLRVTMMRRIINVVLKGDTILKQKSSMWLVYKERPVLLAMKKKAHCRDCDCLFILHTRSIN
jgi:hypothetical protein